MIPVSWTCFKVSGGGVRMAQRQGDGLLAFGSRILIEAKSADAGEPWVQPLFLSLDSRLQARETSAKDCHVFTHSGRFSCQGTLPRRRVRPRYRCCHRGPFRCRVLAGRDVNGGPRPPSDYIYITKIKGKQVCSMPTKRSSPGVWGGCPITDEDAASAALQ